jgi:hypothetical protein
MGLKKSTHAILEKNMSMTQKLGKAETRFSTQLLAVKWPLSLILPQYGSYFP